MTAEQQVPVGCYLLVELYPDLAAHLTTITGVWVSLEQTSGVRSITDLAVVSQPTLDKILFKAK